MSNVPRFTRKPEKPNKRGCFRNFMQKHETNCDQADLPALCHEYMLAFDLQLNNGQGSTYAACRNRGSRPTLSPSNTPLMHPCCCVLNELSLSIQWLANRVRSCTLGNKRRFVSACIQLEILFQRSSSKNLVPEIGHVLGLPVGQ